MSKRINPRTLDNRLKDKLCGVCNRKNKISERQQFLGLQCRDCDKRDESDILGVPCNPPSLADQDRTAAEWVMRYCWDYVGEGLTPDQAEKKISDNFVLYQATAEKRLAILKRGIAQFRESFATVARFR